MEQNYHIFISMIPTRRFTYTLGDGDLPICEYLDILESAGYKGMYALEQNDPRYRSNPRQADIQSIRWLKKAWNF